MWHSRRGPFDGSEQVARTNAAGRRPFCALPAPDSGAVNAWAAGGVTAQGQGLFYCPTGARVRSGWARCHPRKMEGRQR